MAVQVDDARSKEQKFQSDAATVQQGKTANAMEKARLKEEAQAIAQSKQSKSAAKSTAKAPTKPETDTQAAATSKKNKGKTKEPEFFTAKEATPPKKK